MKSIFFDEKFNNETKTMESIIKPQYDRQNGTNPIRGVISGVGKWNFWWQYQNDSKIIENFVTDTNSNAVMFAKKCNALRFVYIGALLSNWKNKENELTKDSYFGMFKLFNGQFRGKLNIEKLVQKEFGKDNGISFRPGYIPSEKNSMFGKIGVFNWFGNLTVEKLTQDCVDFVDGKHLFTSSQDSKWKGFACDSNWGED